MQCKYYRRLNIVSMAIFLTLIAGLTVSSAQSGVNRKATVLPTGVEPIGLTMDFWANAYTVDRSTGKVFCLPAGSEPVHYATLDAAPTSLAVDSHRTLFVGTTSGDIMAVRRDGKVTLACRCSGPVVGLAVDRDGGLLIATAGGGVHKVRRSELNPHD